MSNTPRSSRKPWTNTAISSPNEAQRRHFAEYLTGLFVAERKTVLGIHDEFAQTTDQSCLNRFLTHVEWQVKDLNLRRLDLLQEDPGTRYSDRGVIPIDNTPIDREGRLIPDAGWYWDHAEERHKIAQDYLFVNYVCTSGKHYPLEFRLFRKEEVCAALKEPFRNHTALCCELIDWVCEQTIPGDFRSCLRIIEPWAGQQRRMSATSGLEPLNSSNPLGSDQFSAGTTSRASAVRTPTAPSTPAATPAISRSAPAPARRTTSDSSPATPARTASPSARGRPCSTATSPKRRPSPCFSTSTTAAAFDRPDASSVSTPTPSAVWPAEPGSRPTTLTTGSWLFPPRTRAVQLDEKHAFVAQKQKHCDPLHPDDDPKGDGWDHVAYDPEHKLVLAVVPGARVAESVEEVVAEVQDRLDEQPPELMTSDEYAAYETVIATTFSEVVPQAPAGPGRRPLWPERRPDPKLTYATVHKEREKDQVVAVHRKVVLGGQEAVDQALKTSVCSRTINTSFVERQHATDRGRNARKARKTYKFSKDWQVHEAMTYFTMDSDNFCWAVRTLRQRRADGRWQRRTPAMAAGLADHEWSLREWLTFPAVQ